jgi:ankyrin repeat protein
LTEAYDQLWKNIEERDEADVALAERAIKWVLCSLWPLHSKVLLEAIQYTIEGSTVVKKEEQSQQEILSLCQDLLTIDEERGVWMLPHASVAEYFDSKGWTVWKGDAFAAKVCLGALEQLQSGKMHEINFAQYVNYNWHKHVERYEKWLGLKNEEEEADPSVAAALKRFLGSPSESSDSYRKWAQAYGRHMEPFEMALFAMCSFGFYYTLSDWWLDGQITEEMALQTNARIENCLMMAARSGYTLICRHLIGLTDVMHPDAGRHAGALHSAISYGGEDILKLLVTEANADVNFPHGQNWTAVEHAAQYRSDMLQWMVDQGVVDLEKENESDGYLFGNALIAAAGLANVESVRILLRAGADANAAVQNGWYGSALVAAAARCRSKGIVEIAKLLLDSGADPNLPLVGGKYGSALEALARSAWSRDGKEDDSRARLLHVLLEAGADPAAVFDRGGHGSVLAAAAFSGEKGFLKAMIDRVGVERALDILRQSKHPDKREFTGREDVERWKDTAAYLAGEVGASKDVLHRIGLWDVEPVSVGVGKWMEFRFTE